MPVILGHATVPSSSTVAVYYLPPGFANTVAYQPSTIAQRVYLGTSPKVSATNGLLVFNSPVNTETYVGSAGATVYATTGNATASSFYYIISTAS